MCKQSLFDYTSLLKKIVNLSTCIKRKRKSATIGPGVNAKTFVHETTLLIFSPIKSMEKPCVAKGPCNVHVNLTGIAGKLKSVKKLKGNMNSNSAGKSM